MWPDGITGTEGDYLTTATDLYTTDSTAVGPNMDGTYGVPGAAQTASPADAGGGAPANYSQAVLDIFKYGAGILSQYANNKQLIDYKRWEATATGPVVQGRPASVTVTAPTVSAGGSLLPWLAIGGVAAFLILRK